MAATTTFPDIPPDRGSSFSHTPRTLRAGFGDGYVQASPDGLNPHKKVWELSFANYSSANVQTITDFLDARGGADPFFWTPPDETPTVPVKQWLWVGTRKKTFPGHATRSLTFTIERVYML